MHRGSDSLVDLTGIDQEKLRLLSQKSMEMPELALLMARYFNLLSKLCLKNYHSHVKDQALDLLTKESQQRHREKQEAEYVPPPKKPTTAYIMYFQDRVNYFQEKYPKYTISDLTRLIAKQWKELPQSQKYPYISEASQMRKRYDSQFNEFKMKRKGAVDIENTINLNENEEDDEARQTMQDISQRDEQNDRI